MRSTLMFGSVVVSVLVGLSALAATDDKGFVRITPDEVSWRDFPNGHGAQLAVVMGDPTKPGIYVSVSEIPASRDGPSSLARRRPTYHCP